MDALFPKEQAERGKPALQVERLTREGVFTDVSFEVHAGEIVALAGLVGAGRSEVAQAVFGIDRADAGSVKVHGKRLRSGSPTAAMAAGIGLVPEDRRQQGLIMDLSIQGNVALASLGRVQKLGLIPFGAERRFASDWVARLQLKYGRLSNPAWTLSGGNQQKVVLAKWLARRPTVLIVDEPTRGIDVGTKAEVHRLLSDLAGQGVAVLMISSELPEVLGMADRVIVLFEGRVSGEFTRAEANEDAIMRAATGVVEDEAAA
jgi:rhamnose transport system ATP-binding protein